jgi:hypothetical protein
MGAGAAAQGRWIQQQMFLALQPVAVKQLRLRRVRLGDEIEPALAAPHETSPSRIGVDHRVHPVQQRLPPRQRIERRARVVGLGLHPRLHLRVLQVLQVPIVVDNLGAEVVVGRRPHRRHRRRLERVNAERNRSGQQCSRQWQQRAWQCLHTNLPGT